jgi:hypothetical protein
MPGTEDGGEGTPGTAVLDDVDDGVEEVVVIDHDISSRNGKKPEYFLPLFRG